MHLAPGRDHVRSAERTTRVCNRAGADDDVHEEVRASFDDKVLTAALVTSIDSDLVHVGGDGEDVVPDTGLCPQR